MNKISIIIPALNEEKGIGGVIGAIPKDELEKMGYEVQILVVDGNSQDRTKDVARVFLLNTTLGRMLKNA